MARMEQKSILFCPNHSSFSPIQAQKRTSLKRIDPFVNKYFFIFIFSSIEKSPFQSLKMSILSEDEKKQLTALLKSKKSGLAEIFPTRSHNSSTSAEWVYLKEHDMFIVHKIGETIELRAKDTLTGRCFYGIKLMPPNSFSKPK
jgi:hypothetical protein